MVDRFLSTDEDDQVGFVFAAAVRPGDHLTTGTIVVEIEHDHDSGVRLHYSPDHSVPHSVWMEPNERVPIQVPKET